MNSRKWIPEPSMDDECVCGHQRREHRRSGRGGCEATFEPLCIGKDGRVCRRFKRQRFEEHADGVIDLMERLQESLAANKRTPLAMRPHETKENE